MKLDKVNVKGISRRMLGCEVLTPSSVGKCWKDIKLSLERGRRIVFDDRGKYAVVKILPEMYPLIDQNLQAMHNRIGFVYPARLQYCADGKWLTDWENDFWFYYEPLSEEAYVFPARIAKLETVWPWWRRKCMRMEYPLFEKDGVKISRRFLVRGNKLQACCDIASCRVTQTNMCWIYFEPLHFVYAKVPTAKELLQMHEELKQKE